MLKPWQAALPEGVFAGFLHKHIVPKLHLCMQSFVINPHQQHLGTFYDTNMINDILILNEL